MEHNLILAGVGGQGILTIAQAISLAAIRRGWHVKQAEVHGMSQRGGEVQSHLRISDREIFSDLIPLGTADMVLAVEPLEALRYVQYLNDNGCIVTSTVPVVNISNYPPIEEVLEKVTKLPHQILVDADRLARAAGSARAANTVMVGAASGLLGFDMVELDTAIREIFERKGDKIVDVNQRACRFGRNAATAYLDGLQRGASAQEVRHWIETLPPEQLGEESADFSEFTLPAEACELSAAEGHACAQTLDDAFREGRSQLYEHEVYRLVELVGAISPPRHHFVTAGMEIDAEMLDRLPGEKVVLKIVSPEIVHKTEAGAVVFVPKDVGAVNREIDRLLARHEGKQIAGVLVVEFVESAKSGFGQELFVGIRSTREFGAIIAAGLGGVDTEFLAHKMKPGVAVAKALAADTDAEGFLELFKKTAAYEIIAGQSRGHSRRVSDGELLRCFRAFIAVARRFCMDRGVEGPDLQELEVNPFAFARQRLVPLDGRGRLATTTVEPAGRPIEKLEHLLEPRSIAVMGVSAKRANFGRIILNNIQACGFPEDHLYVIKPGTTEIDGVRCVDGVNEIPEAVDLLVVATASEQMPAFIDEMIDSGKVESVILIPGGLGETVGTQETREKVRNAILASRSRSDKGPVFVGPNSLGIRSRPGSYDTFFIPSSKLDPRRQAPPRRAALLSQSGAFIISRMSNIEFLDPTLAISLGNQIDTTVSDMLRVVGKRNDIDTIGVYVEGFNDLDGHAFVRSVSEVTACGKTVVFYKAGRTAPGRAATAGHTASVAGDYDICQTAVANAGAIVTDTFKEFEQLMELSTALHEKKIAGRRIAAMSNAGYETVGMADAILGTRYQLELPPLSDQAAARISDCLASHKLSALVNVRNPLDLTPMADESTYECCIRAIMDDDHFDALIVSMVPLTPQLLTTEDELTKSGSLADILPEILKASTKPLVAVIDSGDYYEPLARRLREAGVPVFRSADQAVRSLGRYVCHRSARALAAEKSARLEQVSAVSKQEKVSV